MFSPLLFICKRLDVVEVYTHISYIGIAFECLSDSKDNLGQCLNCSFWGGCSVTFKFQKRKPTNQTPTEIAYSSNVRFPPFFYVLLFSSFPACFWYVECWRPPGFVCGLVPFPAIISLFWFICTVAPTGPSLEFDPT